MESQAFEVVISNEAIISLEQIYDYGIETFSLNAATIFIEELTGKIDDLSVNYLLYPECRFIPTESKMYRMLVFGSYNSVYKIIKTRVELLNVLHSSRSPSMFRSLRSVKP